MLFKRFCFVLVVLLIFVSALPAQGVSIENINSNKFRGVRSIEGKGYYTFYVNDRATKGYRRFILEIYDLQLNPIRKTGIDLPKSTQLNDAVFNGSNFLFSFIDLRKSKATYITFDFEGNEIARREAMQMSQISTSNPSYYPRVFDAGGEGFIIVEYVKENRNGYTVERIGSQLDSRWMKKFVPSTGIAFAMYVESSKDVLVIGQLWREKLMSRQSVSKIVILDNKTGKLTGERNLYDGKYLFMPSAFIIEEDGEIVMTGMYFDGPKLKSGNSDGVFFLKLDKKGEEMIARRYPWEGDLEARLEAAAGKGVLQSKPKAMFHEIRKNGGIYQVVGELFTKSMGASGMALGGGIAGTDPGANLNVLDLVVFDFVGEIGELVGLKLFSKAPRKVWVPTSASSGLAMAMYAKTYNLFSYRFMTETVGGEKVLVYFTWEKRQPVIGLVNIMVEETRKLALSHKASSERHASAIQSERGWVLVYEYNPRTKMLKMWHERIE